MARPAAVSPQAAPHIVMHATQPTGAHVSTQANAGSHAVSGMRIVRTRSGALVLRPPLHGTSPVRASGTVGGSNRSLLSEDVVPGLGFDYSHFAATHPQGVHNHNRNRGFVGGFVPFFSGGGYYMPIGVDDLEEAPAADAQQVAAAEPEPAQPALRPGDSDSPRSRRPTADAVPARESEQYVFVRRDGTVFFAVAYSWENGTLRYITNEGLRRTVTGDKLDLDATQQFNEQRGLNFHLPA